MGERSGIAATHSHTASMRLKSHGRLCHRQDNTAAIGLDEAAEEDRERSARSARVGVGEELEGEGEG